MVATTLAAWNAWEAAQDAFVSGRNSEAWQHLAALATLAPDSFRARLLMARLSYRERAYSRALDMVDDFLQKIRHGEERGDDLSDYGTDVATALLVASAAAASAGENETAAAMMKKLLARSADEEKAPLYARLAALSTDQRNPRYYRQAVADFRASLRGLRPFRRYLNSDSQPIKVGYLAADFSAPRHRSLAALLRCGHNADSVRPYFYRYAPKWLGKNRSNDEIDEVDELYDSSDIFWRDLSRLSPYDAAEAIHDDGVFLLCLLDGYVAFSVSPLAILAYRPAPVQIAGPGLNVARSTGLPFIDYLIGDRRLFGPYVPPAPPETEDAAGTPTADGALAERRAFIRSASASLAASNAAAQGRSAGRAASSIHLGYTMHDISQMTDIVELDDSQADGAAEEKPSRLAKLAGGLARNISRAAGKLAGKDEEKNEPANEVDERAGLFKTVVDGFPDNAIYLKEHPNYTEKIIVLPETAWAGKLDISLPDETAASGAAVENGVADGLAENGTETNQNEADAADGKETATPPPFRVLALTPCRHYTQETLALWQKIAASYPRAVLCLCHSLPDHNDAVRFVRAPLERAGISRQQISLIPIEKDIISAVKNNVFSVEAAIDDGTAPPALVAALLAAKIPVISRCGQFGVKEDRIDRRVSGSLLAALGLSELVAPDDDAFLAVFAKLAGEEMRRRNLASSLPALVAASPFGQGERFIRNLERAYRFVQRRYANRNSGAAEELIDYAPDEENAGKNKHSGLLAALKSWLAGKK